MLSLFFTSKYAFVEKEVLVHFSITFKKSTYYINNILQKHVLIVMFSDS